MYAAQIQTGELRPQDLPTTYGDWSDYARFAVTFAPKDREGCREFATSAFARWRRTGEVPRALQEQRACLWFEQRRWRFMGRDPDDQLSLRIFAAQRIVVVDRGDAVEAEALASLEVDEEQADLARLEQVAGC